MELPRYHAPRPSGGLGGLVGGLPQDPQIQVVELARQLRRRNVACPEVGRGVRRWRSRLPKERRRSEGMQLLMRGRPMRRVATAPFEVWMAARRIAEGNPKDRG